MTVSSVRGNSIPSAYDQGSIKCGWEEFERTDIAMKANRAVDPALVLRSGAVGWRTDCYGTEDVAACPDRHTSGK
jgi:hypothetical protein